MVDILLGDRVAGKLEEDTLTCWARVSDSEPCVEALLAMNVTT
jgi:hypothetical protein